MAVHEIGYLVAQGALQCWFWMQDPCPTFERYALPIRAEPRLQSAPAQKISRPKAANFVHREVGYEELGFAVYERAKEEWYRIRSSAGHSYWVHLPELRARLGAQADGWQYRALEDILGPGMFSAGQGFGEHLRKDDLATRFQLTPPMLQKMRDELIQQVLRERKIELPVARIEVRSKCKQTEVAKGSTRGSCEPFRKAPVFAQPAREGRKIMDATLSWAHIAGKNESFNAAEVVEHLLVYEERGDWLRVRLVVGPQADRRVWLHRSDLVSARVHAFVAQRERLRAFVETAEGESGDQGGTLRLLLDDPIKPEIVGTGKVRWGKDGILWVEVKVHENFGDCATAEDVHSAVVAWLPYKVKSEGDPVVNWASRGC